MKKKTKNLIKDIEVNELEKKYILLGQLQSSYNMTFNNLFLLRDRIRELKAKIKELEELNSISNDK